MRRSTSQITADAGLIPLLEKEPPRQSLGAQLPMENGRNFSQAMSSPQQLRDRISSTISGGENEEEDDEKWMPPQGRVQHKPIQSVKAYMAQWREMSQGINNILDKRALVRRYLPSLQNTLTQTPREPEVQTHRLILAPRRPAKKG